MGKHIGEGDLDVLPKTFLGGQGRGFIFCPFFTLLKLKIQNNIFLKLEIILHKCQKIISYQNRDVN